MPSESPEGAYKEVRVACCPHVPMGQAVGRTAPPHAGASAAPATPTHPPPPAKKWASGCSTMAAAARPDAGRLVP